jgi:hypothetical protein
LDKKISLFIMTVESLKRKTENSFGHMLMRLEKFY